MDDIDELQRLGLISKICSELDNHLGFSDKTLAEFIVHLSQEHDNAKSFQCALLENGAEFPDKFTENILRIIHRITKPIKKEESVVAAFVPRTREDIMFPGLAKPNTVPVPLVGMSKELGEDDFKDKKGKFNSSDGVTNSREKRANESTRSRSRSPERSKKRKSIPSEPQICEIYDGKVTNILDFGCFVELDGFSRVEGLVHVAQIQQGMVANPRQVVKRGQRVKVKLISMVGSKLALSMKEVDQATGQDLFPQRSKEAASKLAGERGGEGALGNCASTSNTSNPVTSARVVAVSDDSEAYTGSKVGGKKLSTPELWEARQLISSGVLKISEYPTFDAVGGNGLLQQVDMEEDVEVEISEAEPAFLKGHSKMSRDLSPIRIVKNPDGSLQRAALHQSQLSKERRELKQAQANNLIDAIPKDLSKPWEDPMPDRGERHFAQELRSINIGGSFELPEWKEKSQKKSLAYGQISTKPLLEQRESLPIYRLKSELCAAIANNQVLVVIGETGSGKVW